MSEENKGGGSRLGCILGGCLGLVLLVGGGVAVVALVAGLGVFGGLTYVTTQVGGMDPVEIAPIPPIAVSPTPVESPTPADASPTPTSPTPADASPTPSPTPAAVDSPSPSPSPSPTPAATPKPTPSPTPKPTPSPSPTPKATPSPTPKPTPSPTPKPTPSPTPAEPVGGPNVGVAVGVEGDATVALLQGRRRIKVPGEVPAGKWEIEATFPGEAPVRTGSVTIVAGTPITISCKASMGICRAK